MTLLEQNQYNTKEYVIGSLTNRNNFQLHTYSETLSGKTECYHSLYLYTSDIQKYAEANLQFIKKYSITGFKGQVGSDCLVIDIDVKGNLLRAKAVAVAILGRLLNDFSLPLHWIRIRFSGYKGFHLVIPAEAFGGFNPSADLPALQEAIVRQLTDEYEDCVDWGIYYHVSLIRIENTVNAKSELFSIPLLPDELRSLTIEQIQEMAKTTRDLSRVDVKCITPLSRLIDLKEECQLGLHRAPEYETPTSIAVDNPAVHPDPKKINTVFKRCKKMADIKVQSEKKELIGHSERLNLGCVLTAFGKEGKNKVHEMLKDQSNYNQGKTQYYLDTMASQSYKPSLCLRICGADNLCESIKIIHRKSPIAFAYTYDPEVDTPQKRFIESFVVDKVVAHLDRIIYSVSDRSFYRYVSGRYELLNDEDLKAAVEPMLPFYVSKQLITSKAMNGVIDRLKLRKEYRYEGGFDEDPFTLNLKNGLLNLKTGELLPHTPQFKSRIQLPIDYDPKATCPMFLQFLNDIFKSNPDTIDYVLKMMAYFLIPSYSFHKVFVWYGIGRNGKGCLVRVIEKILGLSNTSHEDIHDLASKQFSPQELQRKLVNFSTELKTDDLDMGTIKKLSGGDIVSADVKYEDKVSFENRARLVILANDLPRFTEIGQAVMQRFEFIGFSRSFLGADADPNLDAKLSTETAGIFNLVSSYIPKIMDASGGIYFEAPPVIEETKKYMISEASTVAEFVREECKAKANTEIRLSIFYTKYFCWAKESGYRPVGKKNLSKTLKETLGLKVDHSSTHDNQVTVTGLEWTKYDGLGKVIQK